MIQLPINKAVMSYYCNEESNKINIDSRTVNNQILLLLSRNS